MKKLLSAAAFGVMLAVVMVGARYLAQPSLAGAEGGAPAAGQVVAGQNTVYPDLGHDNPIYYRGLWGDTNRRSWGKADDGKAVFSDWTWMDFLWGADRYKRGYQPTQPINYNHQVHMEKNQMECTYCHSGVTKSNFATLPSVELCMGCHKSVRTDAPDIKKLKEAFDKGQPVDWVPVNNLPEHVQFNHKRHLKAGVTCQTCHGMVQKMAKVERMSSFKMGWCVSCHRENGASIDCSLCHY